MSDPVERQALPDQSVFDRDPCDGCDGTCGDVCPVMEAQRHALERVQSRSEIRRDAVMDPVGLAHRHAEVVIERDRLRAEVTHLKEEQVSLVGALGDAQAEVERLKDESMDLLAAQGRLASWLDDSKAEARRFAAALESIAEMDCTCTGFYRCGTCVQTITNAAESALQSDEQEAR